MALHGNQKKFDKNGDGKLSAGEWQNWYLRTYGVDIEHAERRKSAQAQANWNAQAAEASEITRRIAEDFLTAALSLLPSDPREAKALAWKALLCQLTTALPESDRWTVCEKTNAGMFVRNRVFYPYRAAACGLANVSGLCSSAELEQAVLTRHPLFQEEGALTAEKCGTFWQQLIAQFPPYYDAAESEFKDGFLYLFFAPGTDRALDHHGNDLLRNLFPLVSFFAGAAESDADRRNNRLLGYLRANWIRLRGKYTEQPDFCDAAVEHLVKRFPELSRYWSQEELAQMESCELLGKLYRTAPEQAAAVWRSLAGTAAPFEDPKKAENFMDALEPVWYDSEDDPELLHPILDVLKKDERFARQIFQSAFVSYYHLNIIKAAYACGEPGLAKHLFELLQENPLPQDQWRQPYDEDFLREMEHSAEK